METPVLAPRLNDVLFSLTVQQLQSLVERSGRKATGSKASLITFLIRTLTDPEFIKQKLQEADPVTRTAVMEAAYAGGKLNLGHFWAKYGVDFELETEHYYLTYPRIERTPAESVAELFFYHGWIPAELISPLRTLLPAPEPVTARAFDTLTESAEFVLTVLEPEDREGLSPPTPYVTEEGALHDLVATLTLIGDGKVLVGASTAQPTLSALRLLRERFLLPDVVPIERSPRGEEAIRPFAFPMIVLAAGLARPREGRLELTKAGNAALAAPTPALLKECWNAWVNWNGFDELSRVRGLKGQKAKGIVLTAPAERKVVINRALANLPTGAWIPVEEVLRYIRINYDFVVDASDYSPLYIGDSFEYGALEQYGVEEWDAVNGSYIQVILLEYAATLGLIDVATVPIEEAILPLSEDNYVSAADFSRYAILAHLRVNDLGRFILGQIDTYSGPAELSRAAALTVLPSLDVVVGDRAALPPNDRAMLERFATRVSEDVYRLTKERLLEATESGLDPRDAHGFLERRGTQALPQTATVFFADAIRVATALRGVGPAQLIECADTHLAVLISHDSVLKSLCFLAGERHLAVPEAGLTAFRRGLRKLGYVLPERALAIKGRKTVGSKTRR